MFELFTIIHFHSKFDFIYLVQKQNGVLGVAGCVFCVTNYIYVQALAINDSYSLNKFSKMSILLVWVCLKRFEFYLIDNNLRCLQHGGVYGITKVSLVKQKISCCKCLFKNIVIIHFGSIYGLCMHKNVIIVDIYNNFFEYIKIFLIICKMVIGVTCLPLE